MSKQLLPTLPQQLAQGGEAKQSRGEIAELTVGGEPGLDEGGESDSHNGKRVGELEQGGSEANGARGEGTKVRMQLPAQQAREDLPDEGLLDGALGGGDHALGQGEEGRPGEVDVVIVG